MSSWLLALFASSQVPYELLAFVLLFIYLLFLAKCNFVNMLLGTTRYHRRLKESSRQRSNHLARPAYGARVRRFWVEFILSYPKFRLTSASFKINLQ